MPVTATPIADNAPGICTNEPVLPGGRAPAPLPVTCLNQHIIVPRIPADAGTGKTILTRTMAIEIRGEQFATIQYVMRDRNGNPVDLTHCLCMPDGSLSASASLSVGDCPCQYKLVFRLNEYLTGGRGKEFNVRAVTPAAGEVEVDLQPEDTRLPGIYFGEFAMIECHDGEDTCDSTVIFSNRVYVHIGRNLWNNRMNCGAPAGPPSISEVRLHLRDTRPEESYLLDNVAFSDEEIAQATILPVEYWNEVPPPIGIYTTATFPYRYHWLMAIAGYLFLIVAEQQRRNNLAYSAGGVQVNDQNREPNYEQAAQRRITEFKDFVRAKKVSINVSQAMGSVGSSYGHRRL